MMIGIICLLIAACRVGDANPLAETKEGPVAVMQLYADSTLKSLLEQQIEIFEKDVKNIDIQTHYLSSEAVRRGFIEGKYCDIWLADGCTEIQLNKMEESGKLFPHQYKVASTALAIVSNIQNGLDSLSMEEMKELVSRGYTKQASGLVIEKGEGMLLQNLLNKLQIDKPSEKIYSLKSHTDVIKYVQENPGMLGIIDYMHLSNRYSDEVIKTKEKIKIVSLISQDSLGIAGSSSANQSDIYSGSYPFIREIYYADCIDTLPYKRVWINWLHSPKSARITLKTGLVPHKMPERNVLVNEDTLPLSNQ